MSDDSRTRDALVAELCALRAELARRSRPSPDAEEAGPAGSSLERANAVIAELDAGGRLVFVTPSIRDLLGYEPEEMLGLASFEWLYEPEAQPTAERFEGMLGAGQTSRALYRARHKDGRWIWLETVATPHRAADGSTRTIVVTHDVDAWKRAREALRASEERFRALAENASDVIAEVDEEGRFLYISPNTEAVLGRRAEGALGRTLRDLGAAHVHPDDAGRLVAGFEGDLLREDAGRIQFRYRHADGSWRWFESTGRAYRLSDGALRAVVISRDVTERMEAEARLRESEERYRILAENARELVGEIDSEGRLVFVSGAFEQITGYRPEQLVGTSGIHRIHVDDVERVVDTFLDAAKAERPVWIPPYRFRHRDRSWRWAEANIVPFRRADGRLHFLGLTRDVTERMRAEEERRVLEQRMQQSQRLEGLGVLAGGIAHDFNNLLTPILGDASLALADLAPDSPLRPRLERIRRAAKRAAALTHQMLAYAGSGPLLVEPLDLSTLVRDMAELLGAAVSGTSVLDLELPTGLPPVEADAAQLSQVVMNLLTNASEALGARGGRIRIRTGVRDVDEGAPVSSVLAEPVPAGRYVQIEVEDDGCGMDEETCARIFDPFFTTKFTGRGLGLAAVLGIVRGHRGALEIASRPAHGTTFRVLLPCGSRPVQRAPVDGGSAGTPSAEANGGRVLVVDDDEGVRELAEDALRRAGLEAVSAGDGDEALRLFREHADAIGAVVLDLTMPGASGEQIFDALRRVRPDARVVLVSGYTEDRVVERIAGRAFAGFLQKPFDPSELVAAVRRALRR